MTVFWTICLIAYFAVACFLFYVVTKLKKDLLQRKHYARHPERVKQEFGGIISDIVCAILWPLQIVGLFVFLARGW